MTQSIGEILSPYGTVEKEHRLTQTGWHSGVWFEKYSHKCSMHNSEPFLIGTFRRVWQYISVCEKYDFYITLVG